MYSAEPTSLRTSLPRSASQAIRPPIDEAATASITPAVEPRDERSEPTNPNERREFAVASRDALAAPDQENGRQLGPWFLGTRAADDLAGRVLLALLACGLRPTQRDARGTTLALLALRHATDVQALEGVLAAAMQAGLDPDERDGEGWTAAMIIAAHPGDEAVRVSLIVQLIEAGMDVNATDRTGRNVAMFIATSLAGARGVVPLLRRCVAAGLDLGARDWWARTLAEIVATHLRDPAAIAALLPDLAGGASASALRAALARNAALTDPQREAIDQGLKRAGRRFPGRDLLRWRPRALLSVLGPGPQSPVEPRPRSPVEPGPRAPAPQGDIGEPWRSRFEAPTLRREGLD